MLISMVSMRAAAGRRDGFVELCREGIPRALRAGCLSAEILVDTEDADAIVLFERWPSEEVFQAFAATEWANAELMARYPELADGMPALRKFSLMGYADSRFTQTSDQVFPAR